MIEEKLYKDKMWLREHYVDLQESTRVMAKIVGCGAATILRWLRIFDIPVRTSGEGHFLACRNYLDISPELLDILNGEILGDGYVGMSSSRSAQYTHSSKYEQYLIWLSKIFADLGLEQSGKITKRWGKEYHCWGHKYNSRSYPELVDIRESWYPQGKKIVPKDLKLTPIMARQFYLGDGSLGNRAKRRPQIAFHTTAFDKASIDHLLGEFRGKGFIVTHQPAANLIGMSVKSVKDFLDWIGPCPIDCYAYKWDYRDNRKSTSHQNKSEYIGG